MPKPADPATVAALGEALDDEYQARAYYDAVIDRFGPVAPFPAIRAAENRHVSALARQYDRLGLAVPQDRHDGSIPAPDSLDAACQNAMAHEVKNAGMYDRLIATTPDPAVQRVFRNLQSASQNNHLPAFEACAAPSARPALVPTPSLPLVPALTPRAAFIAGVVVGAALIWWMTRRRPRVSKSDSAT